MHKTAPNNKRQPRLDFMVVFRNRYLLIYDIIIVIAAFCGGNMFINNIYEVMYAVLDNITALAFTVAVFVAVMFLFRMYTVMWVHSGTWDYVRVISACMAAAAICCAAKLTIFRAMFYKTYVIGLFLACCGIVGLRMFIHGMHHIYRGWEHGKTTAKRMLIVGAGNSAAMMMHDIDDNDKLNYRIVGFVDDDPKKRNLSINGIRVLGNRSDIENICREYEVDEILIAMSSAPQSTVTDIIGICNKTDCRVKIMPSLDQMLREPSKYQMRDVEIDDLLGRDPIVLDNTEISGSIKDRVILVTGGGGSIGSELCRQIMRFDPKKLVILDIYENNAYELQMELNAKYPNNKPDVVIASVRDMGRLEEIFCRYRPYMVFHAAAHKHVPLMESSPGEAIKNNVFGTYNTAKCADKYGVKRFVMISTDKAVNPTNVMGATKRICEMIVQTAQKDSKTEFVCVRFGNVLGSNGSVIPLFKKQIAAGGPVTVTDKRITRFFMTIPEAAQLVLQAASYAKGGEIFVLDMGKPIKIYDLAKNLIRLSGYKPNEDIKIVECGLRPGEKLYEELLMNEEGLTNTRHKKIFIGKPIDIDAERLHKMLRVLEKAEVSGDAEAIKDAIAETVPTYVRQQTAQQDTEGR